MLNNCKKLLYIQLLRLLNINEIRYSKDSKKRMNAFLLIICYFIIGFSIITYVCALAYFICTIGMVQLIPAYTLAITSVIILFFTIFKASSILFGAKDYEQLISLPLNPSTILVSRALTMYLSNLAFVFVTVIPSMILYCSYVKVNYLFFIMVVFSSLCIPLIPMAIASLIGFIITVISSKMKHKTLFTVIFTATASIGILALSMNTGNIDQSTLSNLSVNLGDQINRLYPLAPLYTNAIVDGELQSFVSFILLSVLVFILFIILAAWKYVAINSALTARSTKSNYQLKELKTNTPLMTLYKKEMKRFFSSAIYLLNTGMGYILMIIAAISLLVVGPDKLEKVLEIPQFSKMLLSIAPLMISTLSCVTSTTTSSISLEGKQWWIPVSLPVETKTVFDSKLLVNLTMAIPASIFTSTVVLIILPFDLMNLILIYLTPITYAVFISVLGITVNANMPIFNWNNETHVVKQSGAVFFSMIIGIISIAIPYLLVFKISFISSNIIILSWTFIVIIVTIILYRYNNRMDLKSIQESN